MLPEMYVLWYLTLGKQRLLLLDILLNDGYLGSNVFLELHGIRDTVLWSHHVGSLLDILELLLSILAPVINALDAVVELIELVNKVFNLLDLLFKLAHTVKLVSDCLDLLLDKVLLVIRQGHGHDLIVLLDGLVESLNAGLVVPEDLLPLLQIFKGSLKVEALLDLLHLLISLLKLDSNGFQALSIPNPGILGLLEELEPGSSLFLGDLPAILNPLNMTVQELGLAKEKIR